MRDLKQRGSLRSISVCNDAGFAASGLDDVVQTRDSLSDYPSRIGQAFQPVEDDLNRLAGDYQDLLVSEAHTSYRPPGIPDGRDMARIAAASEQDMATAGKRIDDALRDIDASIDTASSYVQAANESCRKAKA